MLDRSIGAHEFPTASQGRASHFRNHPRKEKTVVPAAPPPDRTLWCHLGSLIGVIGSCRRYLLLVAE
jgi:hypothetical protein